MRFSSLAILFVAVAVAAPHRANRTFVTTGTISTLTALPGETITVEALGRRWDWTAPRAPGLYPIQVDSVTIQAFVLVPYNRLKGEYINGYRIGRYPARALGGRAIYHAPAGFIEVTRANENTFVTPHFRLKQFLCKQSGSYPKYVVLDERLLQKLEHLLDVANDAGLRASTFTVMSGYRTPAYNRALGNVPYSRHTWGAAADIFIDENADGRMDDLNADGRSDVRDAEVLYRLFDEAQERGGMGKYKPTAAHGAFVHVDIRDRRARW
jgi:hypothetical protein